MRFNVGEVQASNGKVKVRAWMSSQGTLHRANSGLDRLNPDHPGKVAGANIEAAMWGGHIAGSHGVLWVAGLR